MTAAALSPVPHLTTALQGPLRQIESTLLARQDEIEAWFRQQWAQVPPPFYASVDLRNAGYKLAPVDTNLFPAGFNNLNPDFHALAVQAMQLALERVCPQARKILLVPEKHTRNRFYLENVATLRDLIEQAGFQVRVGTVSAAIETQQEEELPSGRKLLLEAVQRDGDKVTLADGFSPCAVLLNNDLSGGVPEALNGIQQQIVPPLSLGWGSRLKSDHFQVYSDVVREFAELVDIDPWLIDPKFRNCGEINFKTREGEDCLARNVAALLIDVKAKYDEYGITERPYCVVKADAGTYGMGIMTVSSPEEVQNLNRKQRKGMASSKEGAEVSQVIIQEGVPTLEELDGKTAEPVVYMVDRFVIGGFYRVHGSKGSQENLNSPGASFERLAFADSCNTPHQELEPDAEPNRFYAYGVIARLALIAAAREIQQSEA
jgi:glutamate--cysteine ligase